MKVEYVFSRNKKFGSKVIAYAASFENTKLEQIPSHVAVLLDDTWIFESTFDSGVRVIPYTSWLELNEELYKIADTRVMHSKDVLSQAAKLWGKGYDWKGVLFFGWCYIKLIFFKEKLPEKNKWQRKNKYFCTEFVGMLNNEDYSMKSPAKICASLMEKTM